ncbi:MAG: hypothetical protein HYU55_04125 [Nocardioides sp.]|nr:hypothetical protein [Nocardioides sp.]
MFDIHCSECGRHQLLSLSRIRQLINDDHGIAVIFECWCGALGAYRTGKNVEELDSWAAAFEGVCPIASPRSPSSRDPALPS